MSEKLAISAALSVLLMSSYVLLGGDAAHAPLGPDSHMASLSASLSAPLQVSLPALPTLDSLLPLLR